MPRYKLRTLLIMLAIGPPLLAGVWIYAVPIVTSFAFFLFAAIIAACMFGAVLGRSLLWAIEGLLTVGTWLMAAVRWAMRRKTPLGREDTVEFSLHRFVSQVKARRRE